MLGTQAILHLTTDNHIRVGIAHNLNLQKAIHILSNHWWWAMPAPQLQLYHRIRSIEMPTKSGAYWVTWANAHAKNSNNVEDLAEPFRSNAKAFIKALKDAGATVTISTTKRNAKRAYLFHWSWKISQGKCKASEAAKMTGVDIQWDHGNEADSKKGAQQMVTGFGLAVPPKSSNPPALTSNHISGKAIDLTIKWTGILKVKNKNGVESSIPFNANVNQNSTLHEAGASYGVKKLKSDAPHWSYDGH